MNSLVSNFFIRISSLQLIICDMFSIFVSFCIFNIFFTFLVNFVFLLISFYIIGDSDGISYDIKRDRVLNSLKLCLFLSNSERAGIRTPDNLIKSQVLYHLSYTPLTGVAGLEPAVQESESCALPLGDTPSMRQLVYIIICFRQLSTLFLNFFKFIFQE